MSRLTYCHCCGLIIKADDKLDLFNITTRDLETKKEIKLFDVCRDCGKKILNIKFKPVKFKPSELKNPKFTGIVLKKMYPKVQEKLIYHVLPYQLQQIKDMEINIDDIKLTYKTGVRLYTEFQVKKWIELDTKNLIDGLMIIYNHQTDDEKKGRETKYSNSVGFNKPDASFMSGMARIYECRGYNTYSEKQLAKIKKIMDKYIKQLTLYINAECKILEGV